MTQDTILADKSPSLQTNEVNSSVTSSPAYKDDDPCLNDSASKKRFLLDYEEADDEPAVSDGLKLDLLSELEICVIRELNSSDILKLFDLLKSGILISTALEMVAPTTVKKVTKALEDQYADNSLSKVELDCTLIESPLDHTIKTFVGTGSTTSNFNEDTLRMARVTPLRLTYEERSFLRLLESTLEVSEYTDKVDVVGRWSPAKKMANEIKQICAVLSGLVVAHKYDAGQKLIRERDFKANSEFFRSVFEIGRRYKILNPDRMRDSYGKLVYFLMDSRNSQVMDLLDFDCVSEVKTVWGILSQKKNGMKLLRDPLLRLATTEIMPEGKTRSRIQWEIKEKENAIKELCKTYSTVNSNSQGLLSRFTSSIFTRPQDRHQQEAIAPQEDETDLTPEEIEQCLYSLCDHNTFLRFNREPCDKMINYLKRYFQPNTHEPGFSLSIACGRAGARLSHSHERQFLYVLQSLTLWREVLHEMLGLWCLAEKDLLSKNNPYALRDTGQGLNRVQDAPFVYRSMCTILSRTQEKVGGWCGSSIIHLGDHNVPNALMFIDKYVQIPRILGPLVLCLDRIPSLYTSTPEMKTYIDNCYGGCDTLIKTILADFYRHAFDGSGADTFYDAGSCIDGRLTSAWNWCSKIERKPYFPIFLLTGFSGFDGRF